MKVTEIWRYPVKTMAGEKLQRVRSGPPGIEGDRVVHVEDAQRAGDHLTLPSAFPGP